MVAVQCNYIKRKWAVLRDAQLIRSGWLTIVSHASNAVLRWHGKRKKLVPHEEVFSAWCLEGSNGDDSHNCGARQVATTRGGVPTRRSFHSTNEGLDLLHCVAYQTSLTHDCLVKHLLIRFHGESDGCHCQPDCKNTSHDVPAFLPHLSMGLALGFSYQGESYHEMVQRFTLRKETLRKEPFRLPLEPLGLIGMLSRGKRVTCPF